MPAQSFRPNGFGLFDVAGNVAEWVEDCWNDTCKGARPMVPHGRAVNASNDPCAAAPLLRRPA
jgi:formylglycine-generating enzyme required for sulfatase activity